MTARPATSTAPRRLAAAALALALAACAAPAAPPAPSTWPAVAPTAAASTETGVAAEVARLVNLHRAQAGCRPLAWDEAAARAAQVHSDDMARRRYFDDVSPEGRGAADRLRLAGAHPVAVAENIAADAATADAVVQGWLGSPEHRAQIETCMFTRHGVGQRDGVWTHVMYLPQ